MSKIKFFFNFLKTKKGIGVLLLFLAVLFNAIFLWSEVSISTFSLNDEVLHFSATQEATLALQQGENPTDFWLSQVGLGFPLFHHYQHFPQIVLTFVHHFTSSFISLSQLFDISRYLLLVLFPASIFLAMRRFGFDNLASGFSALVASLLSTNFLYGLDYGSYIWRGSGLYTQLWAMFFLPLALAEIYRAVRGENRLFWSILLSSIVILSNLFYGYILILSAALFIIIRLKKELIIYRFKRLMLIFLLMGIVTSYFWIPFFIDRKYVNRSIWEQSFKYDSFGAFKVLGDLIGGRLFDAGRIISVLTIFFFLGILLMILRKRSKERYRFLLYLSGFWLVLYFGRPTWGNLLNLLPFSDYLHLHRFIGGFHLAAIMVIGVGISLIFKWAQKKSYNFIVLLTLIIIMIFVPIFSERIKFYNQNTIWRLENHDAFLLAQGELLDIQDAFEVLPPGRIYVGLASNWGNYPYYQVGFVPLYAIFPQLGLDSFGYAYHAEGIGNDIRLHFDDTKLVQYNLFNIRYVLLHKTWSAPSYYSPIKEFKNYILYEVSTTGYFDLVDAPAVFYGESSDFYYPNSKWLFSSLPELKQHPIIEIGKTPQKTFGLPVFSFQKVDEEILSDFALEQSERGKILNEKIEINKYWAQFEVKRDSYLVLKTNYHPGWDAYLDYEEVSPVMLAPGFIAIKVGPGIHQALFVYKSPAYRSFLFFFGAFVLLMLFLNNFRFIDKKRLGNIWLKLKKTKKSLKNGLLY